MKNTTQFRFFFNIGWLILLATACNKGNQPTPAPAPPPALALVGYAVNGFAGSNLFTNVTLLPTLRFQFNQKVDKASLGSAVTFQKSDGSNVGFTPFWENGDSVLLVQSSKLDGLSRYQFNISNALKSTKGTSFSAGITLSLQTLIDSTDKFPLINDDALLTLVQRQTFRFFWDFGHPQSGMARERNTSGDLVTTGGTGFGIMAIIAGIQRGFVTRVDGLDRIATIINFLKTKGVRYHGAFPHWLNGATGATIPFSANDNGADLVETSFLMMGMLSAKGYFNQNTSIESNLRSSITELYEAVEWSWFRKGNEKVLYWHWSPTVGWVQNLKIQGWNECLVTYVLAASSPTYPIPDSVYHEGFARNGAFVNGNSYYGYKLPLGSNLGGPLFLSQYTFLGINPTGLKDKYADYWLQNRNHSLINYAYCAANPLGMQGYSQLCWGLSASDIPNGYAASSPSADIGVIAPTAAIAAMPYCPEESMGALRFFYYKLGDKLWKEYGFIDAFSLKELWFANAFLAIDQAPQIVMIENYRTSLLWDLFSKLPEIKNGLKKLGFSAPYL